MADVDRTKEEIEEHESKGNPHSGSASDTELSNHASTSGAHHSRPSPGKNITEDANGNFDAKGGMWTHDGSIDKTGLSASSYTYTLASNWDVIRVEIAEWVHDGSTYAHDRSQIRLNGDSSSNAYDQVFLDGTNGTQTAFDLDRSTKSHAVSGTLEIEGRFTANAGANWRRREGGNMEAGYIMEMGRAEAVTSPINSITFKMVGNNMNISADIYGRNYK